MAGDEAIDLKERVTLSMANVDVLFDGLSSLHVIGSRSSLALPRRRRTISGSEMKGLSLSKMAFASASF
jgi:hypothetical protein